jgi:hypothetical protein
VAIFTRDMRRLTLLPGYIGELGYNPARHAMPAHLAGEWWEYRNPRDASFDDFLGRVLTPLRRVALAPFLIETTAAPLAPMHPDPGVPEVMQIERPPKHAALLAELMGQGFRYPTVDEWEYACSGGSRALFRWGDIWPPIRRFPVRMREPDDWREDTLPNAFGLAIGLDPQELEFCMEPGELKGGDGGWSSQTNSPDLEWLGFATSTRSLPAEVDNWYDPYLRRVVPLDRVL